MLAPVRVAPPASAILTLAEVKANLRVDHDEEDVLIAGLIEAATAHLDGWGGTLGRALIEQRWRQDFPAFPPRAGVFGGVSVLRLPLAPLIAVEAVTYRDPDDAVQTLDPGAYLVHEDVLGPYVRLRSGASWPATAVRDDAVSVTATYGYGPSATDVPAAILIAALMLVGHLYEHREGKEAPPGMDALLAPWRRVA